MSGADVSPIDLKDDRVTTEAAEPALVGPNHGGVTWTERPWVLFCCAFAVRVFIAAVFLGSCDLLIAIASIPTAASHGYFYIPYFPVIDNILGASALVITKLHFIPLGLVPKLIPCLADSLIAVWFIRDNRFDKQYRKRAAWLYIFCPLPIILICIQGQWDSMWVLPMVSALAMADLLKHATSSRRRTLLIIGALLGIAVLSKPVAIITAGLLVPNFWGRTSTKAWIQDCGFILIGFSMTMGLFLAKFALDGTNLHRNLDNIVSYAGSPGFTVFGPAEFFSHAYSTAHLAHSVATHLVTVNTDLRDLSIIYVLAIVLYQILARVPLDKMTAAAAVLLICPAVGGFAPQYLFWPLVFILAAGRFRAFVMYALSASSLYFLFFLIPGASAIKGESSAAYVPLRSLSFLGVPHSALEWFANSPVALDIWNPLANLIAPIAMCGFGLYLLVSRTTPKYAHDENHLQPLGLRSIRTCIPYVAALVVASVVYGIYSNSNLSATYVTLDAGVRKYAFLHPIFNTRYWSDVFYFTTRSPWNDLGSGAWWGSILVLGPLLIVAWGVAACRYFSSNDALIRRDDMGQPFTKVIGSKWNERQHRVVR
jgi:hypothetical protein